MNMHYANIFVLFCMVSYC